MVSMQRTQPGPASGQPLQPAARELPQPDPGQLLLEVTACAVCRV
jgi:hypothetical protein